MSIFRNPYTYAALVALVVGVVVAVNRRAPAPTSPTDNSSAVAHTTTAPGTVASTDPTPAAPPPLSPVAPPSGNGISAATMAVPVQQPPSDDAVDETLAYRQRQARLVSEGYGSFKAIRLDDLASNPQKASVVEALATGNHGERVSVMGRRKPFDADAWDRSQAYRDAYLSVVEPGRVYDLAQPGIGVARAKRTSPAFVEASQVDIVMLSLQAAPNAPVTFTAMDGGSFENDLGSITVTADANGHASASFRAGSGVAADCNVLAGSPLTSGIVTFLLSISVPETPARQ